MTNSTLAVATGQNFWNAQQLAALKQIGVENAPDADLAVFLNFAQKTGLDPFARQIYMIGRNSKEGKKWTIQASIDGLRIVAERSGKYAGQVGPEYCGKDGVWRDTWVSKEYPVAARVGVLRKGFMSPLYAVAYFDEYAQKFGQNLGQMWADKPLLMLAKCAESLALRKAFPNDLSGLYTAEEVSKDEEPEMVEAEVVEEDLEITPTQASFVIGLFEKAGLADLEAKLSFASDTLGRQIEDISAITKRESYALIEAVKNVKPEPTEAEIIQGLKDKIKAHFPKLTNKEIVAEIFAFTSKEKDWTSTELQGFLDFLESQPTEVA